MNALRLLTLMLATSALAACAGKTARPSPPAPADAPTAIAVPIAGPPTEATPTADATDTVAASPANSTAPVAAEAEDTPAEAVDDYAALYGGTDNAVTQRPVASSIEGGAYDPWEPFNRRIHRFNNVVDRAIAKPLATAYVNVVPHPLRLGVTNFFDNLSSPLTLVNQMLQGRPRDAVQTLGRFVVNSTLGIAGLFDPASDLKMKRRSEDFGQTLGMWGWRSSRYVELPLFGPRTLRDTFGLVGDIPLSPLRQVEDDKVRIGLQGLQLVDTRAQLLSLDSLRANAPDEYTLTRDAWMQRRAYQIERDRLRKPDEALPDYLHDEDDHTIPVDAMPMPPIGK